MVWVKVFVTTLTALLVTISLSVTQPTKKDVDITSLNEHMKKMDAVLQEVQSHSQAQEQKYSAVLSSVLSQLTQTTEELEELKASRNTTEQEVLNLKEELKNLTDIDNNAQLELTQLNQSHNKTLFELAQLNQSHSQSLIELDMVKTASLYRNSGFEASLLQAKVFSASSTIVFDKISYNEGSGYNKTTGYFTAPVSGIYLFWINAVYRSDKSAIMFYIGTSEENFGRAYGRADEIFGTASTTTIYYLKKGERVWIITTKDVELIADYTSTGAVMIKQY